MANFIFQTGVNSPGGSQPEGSPSGLLGYLEEPLVIFCICVVIIVILLISICAVLCYCRDPIFDCYNKLYSVSHQQHPMNNREGINPYLYYPPPTRRYK